MNTKTRIQNPDSKIRDWESKIQNPQSKIEWLALLLLAGAWLADQGPAVAQTAPAVLAELQKHEAINQHGPYQATWESLKTHQDPDWFRDAKLGIYTHWGPITVATDPAPAGMEWYGRELYDPKNPAFAYHKKRFGDQHAVGYKDVIPHFHAERFNADEWAELFARSGAKFAGPVAVHHDNFAMWDSALTRWNSKAMGPRRDITGELEAAIRKRGMKFLTTFHHGFAWRYFEPAFTFDAADGKNADLYTEPHGPKDPPSSRFQDTWLAMVDEVLDRHQPDLIWFDFELNAVITPAYQRQMFASVYNWAAVNHREIGVTHKFREIHQNTGILDFERGREDRLTPYPWLTDTALGPWFHHEVLGYRSTDELVDVFVDIVSKNGCLLLNVGPRADGTIPEKAKPILLGIGDWLKVNGEAIYGTRPWTVFGEGPTRMQKRGGFTEDQEKAFTARDIRFTTRGDVLYAIALAWPESGQLVVRSLPQAAGSVLDVRLLGHPAMLEWSQTDAGLVVKLPASKPCDYAYVLKISASHLQAAGGESAATSLRRELKPARRYGKVIGLKDEKIAEYKRLHAAVWPEVNAMISACNIRNFTIFVRKLPDGKHYLFLYFEYVGTDLDGDMKKMAADPRTQEWWKLTDPCQNPLPDRVPGQWWADMEEVCHTP